MENLEEHLNNILVSIFNNISVIEEESINSESSGEVTIKEMHTIEAIGIYEPKTMSQTANVLGITLGTLTTAVNNLVKKGYVKRDRSDRDRRIVEIGLTYKGKNVYKLHENFHIKIVNNMIKNLSRDEILVLINCLKNVQNIYMVHSNK